MNSALERLLSLRVSQVMTKRVIEVSPHQTLAEAATLLSKHSLSGAPVVDELGHCVGILTATDFLVQEGRLAESSQDRPLPGKDLEIRSDSEEEPIHMDTVDHEFVRHHMSDHVESVDKDMTLLNAARKMCDLHVHRLPVLDERQHVLGMISSLDIVAALVQATEE